LESQRLDKPLERCNIIAGSEDIFGIVFGIGMVELVIGKPTELISLIQRYIIGIGVAERSDGKLAALTRVQVNLYWQD